MAGEIARKQGEVEQLPTRDSIVVLGARSFGAAELATRLEQIALERSLGDDAVQFTRSAAGAANVFFGRTLDSPDAPRTLPRGVVAFDWMRDYSGSHGQMVPFEASGVDELCERYSVPLVRAEMLDENQLSLAIGQLALDPPTASGELTA